MLNKTLISLYTRDLNKLKEELNAYTDEATIWQIQDGISNSAGNLALHLIGNLNHFIGATLGNTGYVREREQEFSLKNVPRAQVLQSIDQVIEVVGNVLGKLTDADLEKPFPINVPIIKDDNSSRFVLMGMLLHLDYHLGQINYHRRLIGK